MSEEQRDEEESCIGHGLVAQHHGKSSSDNDMNAILPCAVNNDGPPLAAAHNKTNDNRCDDTAASPESDQNKSNLRRGKWTPEEEAYARAVISDFNSGYLDAPIGTTLRAFLSTKLECDPMRVTKKFTKEDSLGKKVFRPAVQSNAKIAKEVEVAQRKVASLYQKWKRKVETQKEEADRKSSAEASAYLQKHQLDASLAAAATMANAVGVPQQRNSTQVTPDTMPLIRKTADWLEKAENILSQRSGKSEEDKVTEMNELKSLIEEGPTVLAAAGEVAKRLTVSKTKGLPSRLNSCPDFRKMTGSSPTSKKRKHPLIDDDLVREYDSNPINLLASLSSRAVPVPVSNNSSIKQIKRKGSDNTEDVKAFVNFIQSVKR